MSTRVHVLEHPLARHCMATLRNRDTELARFRALTRQLTTILTIEATRDLRTTVKQVETPLEDTTVEVLDESLVVVPILRAGLGMLDAVVALLPDVAVGYLGLERDEATAEASSYYSKMPALDGRSVLLIDPMLATGGSACRALAEIEKEQPSRISMLCLVAAPEGVDQVLRTFSDVVIYTAALDRELDERKYILPGLGDYGDRLYGTT